MDNIETRKIEGYTIRIVQDEEPMNPRGDDNLGYILYTSSRYVLGDKQVSSEKIEKIIKDEETYIWLPVYAFIHSGIRVSTKMFSDHFDSGQCGIIYCTRESALEYSEYEDSVKKILDNEIEIFSKFLSGEVYGFILEDEDGIEIDSCYGFYDIEEAFEVAKEHIPVSYGTPELYKRNVETVVKGPVSLREDLDWIYIGTLFRDNRKPIDLYASDTGYHWSNGECVFKTTGRKVKELQAKYMKDFSGGSFEYRIPPEVG